MSDGINICFGNADFKRPKPESLANLLASARFKTPNTKDRGQTLVIEDTLSKRSATELLASACRERTRLKFIESPYEYFSLSFFSAGDTSDCVLLSTDTRTQTRNSMDRLALYGFTFLDFVVAIAECFIADSFADTESGDLDQLKLGVFNPSYPPAIAYSVHPGVTDAMLDSGMKCWNTRIGKVWGLGQWYEKPVTET